MSTFCEVKRIESVGAAGGGNKSFRYFKCFAKKKKKKRENAKSCWYLHDLMKEADNVLTQLGGKLLCHLFPKKCEFQP